MEHQMNEHKVSIIVPTWNRAELLTKRCLPSIQKQTHRNLEIIVVGDHCTDNTDKLVSVMRDKDPRIVWENLPERGEYPEEVMARWNVAGTVPINRALDLATAEWVAHLDDDDEYTPDHIEVLLTAALEGFDFVYGIIEAVNSQNGNRRRIGAPSPRRAGLSRMSVLHKRTDLRFDINCWQWDEPGDWNFYKRLLIKDKMRWKFLPVLVGYHYDEGSRRREVGYPI